MSIKGFELTLIHYAYYAVISLIFHLMVITGLINTFLDTLLMKKLAILIFLC